MPQIVIGQAAPQRAQLTLLSGPRAAHVSPDCDLLALTAAAFTLVSYALWRWYVSHVARHPAAMPDPDPHIARHEPTGDL